VQNLTKDCISYENGVLGGVVSALNVLCSRGDNVLLHSPTYIGFTGSLKNNGYNIVHSPLKIDEKGVWRMDFKDMEEKIKSNNIHATVFCSPHNPCGRVWELWEIEKAMEIFKENDVYVISDEIWSDLILNGRKHIPAQSVSEDARNRTVAIYAPSKTFNLAGLVGSYSITYNKHLRDRMKKESSLSHYNSMNVLSMHALIGAYKPEGQEWVDELCQVLSDNVNYAYDYICTRFKGVSLAKPEGTYMLFLDCSEWCKAHGKSISDLLKLGYEVGVIWQDGRPFHGPNAIRMNLALPHSRVIEAFERLDKYVFNAE
jgi:cystathionine beta-lyase